MDGFDDAAATILYVDDEEMARKYFVRTIACEHEVIVAASAADAMNILKAEGARIGILVSDYRMPGDNGDELLRRTQSAYPYLVRILVTAYADKDVLLKTVNSSEVFRILEKPLDMAEVRSTLMLARDLWQRRVARRQRLKAIDETLLFIAHQINTPLATIVNYANGIEQALSCDATPFPQRSEIEFASVSMGDNAQYCLSVLSGFVESVQRAGARGEGTGGTAVSQIISVLLDTYPLPPDRLGLIHVDIKRDFRITRFPNCVSLVLGSVLANALRALKRGVSSQIRMMTLVDGHPQIRVSYIGDKPQLDPLSSVGSTSTSTYEKDCRDSWAVDFCNRIMRTVGGSITVQTGKGASVMVILNFPKCKNVG